MILRLAVLLLFSCALWVEVTAESEGTFDHCPGNEQGVWRRYAVVDHEVQSGGRIESVTAKYLGCYWDTAEVSFPGYVRNVSNGMVGIMLPVFRRRPSIRVELQSAIEASSRSQGNGDSKGWYVIPDPERLRLSVDIGVPEVMDVLVLDAFSEEACAGRRKAFVAFVRNARSPVRQRLSFDIRLPCT